jgi:hypothetical protein
VLAALTMISGSESWLILSSLLKSKGVKSISRLCQIRGFGSRENFT